MSNILNHNRKTFDFSVSKSDYWDMHLYKQQSGGVLSDGTQDDCLSAYIDTTIRMCVVDNGLVSYYDEEDKYKWVGAVNKGTVLNNIGLTGVDNGLLLFDKDTTTQEEFDELFTKSTLEIDADDMRLHLSAVGGNNKIYSYDVYNVTEDDKNISQLDGGFYQGFFKTDKGCDYQILPTKLGNGWCMEFVLKPEFDGFDSDSVIEYEDDCVSFGCEKYRLKTLNETYPENKGIFFYIGTRAENKWYKYYNSDETTEITTFDGTRLDSKYTIVETNNKHITYNRTPKGYRAVDGNNDGANKVLLRDPNIPNYFPLMNRSKTGYTAFTVDNIEEDGTGNDKYNILADLFRNALAFQVKDDGSVGYKFMVKDCDSEEGYSISQEWSYPGMVENDKWCHIAVRVVPVIKYANEMYNYMPELDYMRLMFYVNGKLVLYSKEIPTLMLRMLNDSYEKQEAVPYNISIGGGTQGLCDVIYSIDSVPEDILYLEKEFGGSFIGYFKIFRFHTCDMNFQKIRQNYIIDMLPSDPTKLFIFYGSYNMFIGHEGLKPSQIPIEEQDILSLNKIKAKKKQFDIDVPENVNRIVIAYPFGFGTDYIKSVIDTSWSDYKSITDITVAFTFKPPLIKTIEIDGKPEKYYVYSLDYAFLNEHNYIYKVNLK